MLSRLLGYTFKGVKMNQSEWDELSQVERLRYALLSPDKFKIIVDLNTIQLESIEPIIDDFIDYHIEDLLNVLNIPYEVA